MPAYTARIVLPRSTKQREKDADITLAASEDVRCGAEEGVLLAQCICHARQIGNLPPNYMTPEAFVEEAQVLAHELSLDIEVLDKKALRKIGAGALLGVNRGSNKGAYLITPELSGQRRCALHGAGRQRHYFRQRRILPETAYFHDLHEV